MDDDQEDYAIRREWGAQAAMLNVSASAPRLREGAYVNAADGR